jgi:hypothetical protein
VQQAREGEAWLIARGRYEHLMVARTTISDGYRARAHAIVALARSWRPQEVMPGTRSWREAEAAAEGALAGLQGHLAIQPPSNDPGDNGVLSPAKPSPQPTRPPDGYRLRLAVAAAAGDGDQDATTALIREGACQGLDTGELVAVAERHWPKPRLAVRALRAGRHWTVARLRRLHRPRRRAGVLAEQEHQP